MFECEINIYDITLFLSGKRSRTCVPDVNSVARVRTAGTR